ncbi:MAG TPA: S-layer family protein [Oculatellaceae cyanobacterium]|jgi:filamentous hemagglutinin family protein
MRTPQVELQNLSLIVWFYLLGTAPTVAQIVPDATLPINSVVTSIDSTNLINGGTKAGSNLFHSFSNFDIPTGNTAFFNNAFDIKNVFSRVTGSSGSNIDGILQTNGTANLFLINPNGIIFGANAQLNIGGSFVATTANAIGFKNQGFFSASVPNNPKLLTVLPSSFLFNQIATQPITSQASLQVAPSQSLLLVGGNVSLDAGGLFALGGRVELGGLAGSGTVEINQDGNNLNLNFPSGEIPKADVELSNSSVVNVSAGGGGSIAINADKFNMTRGSSLSAGIASGMGSASSIAGNVEINAKGVITLDDESFISNDVLVGGMGHAGNIKIASGSLSLSNGAQVSASTYADGNAGSVTIVAQDAVSLDGTISNNGYSSTIFSTVVPGAVGNAGNVFLTTGSLSLANGAQLTASTFGQGNAGSVTVVAKDTVSFDETDIYGFSSGIFSSVETGAIGNGSNISITTGSLFLTNGAQVVASTAGQGNAGSVSIFAQDVVSLDGTNSLGYPSAIFSDVEIGGVGNGSNINITTGSLSLTNGAQLIARTRGQGNAGSVNIFAQDAVRLDGTIRNGRSSAIFSSVGTGAIGKANNINITTGSLFLTNGAQLIASTSGQGNAGSVNIFAKERVSLDGTNIESISGILSAVEAEGVGNGGNIFITTDSLYLTNKAQVSAKSEGTGDAGNITNITAHSLSLDNASITTGSISGNGGNIANLQVNDLRLRNGSEISTTAGTAESGLGNGGNINFNLDTLVALENSNIAANAFGGRGGNIQINTTGLFQSPDSQITASSQLGLNGEIKVNTPGIDPSKGLINLPAKVTDVSQLVAQSCTSETASSQSNLTVTGRGGLPANPTEVLTGETVLVDLETPSTHITKSPEITPQAISIKSQPQFIEATGWRFNNNGVVTLVANAANVTPQKLWHNSQGCNGNG